MMAIRILKRSARRLLWWFWAAILLTTHSTWAQQRPLQTEDTDLVKQGRVRAQFGFEFLQNKRYSLSGLEGDLTRVAVLSAYFGLGGRTDFQASGVIRDFLSVSRRGPALIPPDFAGDTTSDVGDFQLAARIKLVDEARQRPAIGFKFAVQLPNASNESGLGADVTNFHAHVLLSKEWKKIQFLGNLGLSILGSAVTPNSQSDMFAYGAATIIPVHPKINLVAEIAGREGAERVGNESRRQVRFGAQFRTAGLRWDLVGIAGLKDFDADSGLAVGITYESQAFGRSKSPKTIK